jgi:broad specificity phosphatase PhoE
MSFSDRELTPFGAQQAAWLAHFFDARKIDVIIHSGLARTRQTAEKIRGNRKIALIEDGAWCEASHGSWEGLTYKQVMTTLRDDALQRFSDPVNAAPSGGESLAQLQQRVCGAFAALGRHHAGKRAVVVTHGGAIQALLCSLLKTPLAEHWRLRIDLGSASGVDVYAATTIVRTINHVPQWM